MSETNNVFKLPHKEPASKEAVVEILRGFLDQAFDEEITYLEINAKVAGEIRSISITT
jgi:hypothetical protein